MKPVTTQSNSSKLWGSAEQFRSFRPRNPGEKICLQTHTKSQHGVRTGNLANIRALQSTVWGRESQDEVNLMDLRASASLSRLFLSRPRGMKRTQLLKANANAKRAFRLIWEHRKGHACSSVLHFFCFIHRIISFLFMITLFHLYSASSHYSLIWVHIYIKTLLRI